MSSLVYYSLRPTINYRLLTQRRSFAVVDTCMSCGVGVNIVGALYQDSFQYHGNKSC